MKVENLAHGIAKSVVEHIRIFDICFVIPIAKKVAIANHFSWWCLMCEADFDDKGLKYLKYVIEKCNPLSISEENPTYMELCRYPGNRLENVWTRLLCFFLNPNKPHGFNTLLLDSLNELLPENKRININQSFEFEVEYVTEKKKRLDLLIVGGDVVVCIENKIWASLYNDLDEYEKTVKKFAHEKCVLLIILSPIQLQHNNWISIGYSELVCKIKEKIGDYKANCCSDEYYFALNDWIKSVEREIMSKSIPQEYITFFNDNFEQLRRLENYRKEYEENCKRAVKRIIQQNELMKDVNRNEKQNKIVNWANGDISFIHITADRYIDCILWKESANKIEKELQIRIVFLKKNDFERKNLKADCLAFSESGKHYIVIQRKYNSIQTESEFIISELLKILKELENE